MTETAAKNANNSIETRDRERVRKIGVVISDSMNKTIIVQVDRRVKHPKYQKFVGRRSKFMAHDEKEASSVGDRVEIMESRPMSARKRWRFVRIVEKAR